MSEMPINLCSVELKDRVEHWVDRWLYEKLKGDRANRGARRLYSVAFVLIGSLVMVNGLGALVIAIIYRKNPEILDHNDKSTPKDTSWFGSDSNPVSTISDDKFNAYFGYFLWVTTMLTGLGLEFLVLLSFVADGTEWTHQTERHWKLAQFFFPLIGTATIGFAMQHNFFVVFTLVAGLWKFGFPETVTYATEALYDTKGNVPYRLSNLINAVGNIVHHGAASLMVCMLLSGALVPERHILNPILILLMQHWFALLVYLNPAMYIVVELCLEAMFEWVLFSSLKHLFTNSWASALATVCMLSAHWMYFAAATVGLFGYRCVNVAETKVGNNSSKTLQTSVSTTNVYGNEDGVDHLEEGMKDEE